LYNFPYPTIEQLNNFAALVKKSIFSLEDHFENNRGAWLKI